MPSDVVRPRIVLTGATGGIGYGIAQRLISDLLLLSPPVTPGPFHTPNGLTLILASRNTKSGQKVAQSLYEYARKRAFSSTPPSSEAQQYRQTWLSNLDIQTVRLDLMDNESVLECCKELDKTQPYLTHVFLNAGAGLFTGINWPLAIYCVLTDIITAVTIPCFLRQGPESLTKDGIGHTWQCNVFGNYVMATNVLHLLEKAPPSQTPRLIWTGSIEGRKSVYDPADLQGLNPDAATYQITKFETNALANIFNTRTLLNKNPPVRTRSFLVCPGVAEGGMFKIIIGEFLNYVMLVAFFIARLLGSATHTITPYKAAVAFTHVGLAGFDQLEHEIKASYDGDKESESSWPVVKFSSCASRLGSEYYTVEHPHPNEPDLTCWWDPDVAQNTINKCEQLQKALSLDTSENT